MGAIEQNMHNLNNPMISGFLKNVLSFPHNNALFVNNEYYTYSELFSISHKIYSQLNQFQTLFDKIGIYCKDDVETYASIIAVSLYGAAYVPINSKYPFIRNNYIVNETQIQVILNARDLIEQNVFSDKILISINLEDYQEENSIDVRQNFIKTNQPLAYILFTSGTTALPKGVPVSIANLNSFFSHFHNQRLYSFSQNDRFLQVYELTFDVSVFSFFMPLSLGACCYVLPQKGIRFLEILKFIKEFDITVISMVPTIIQFMGKYLDEIKFPSLKYSFFSGDKLSHNCATHWARSAYNATLINYYGPTETTIVCTYYPWNEYDSQLQSVNDVVPIGKSFEGMEFVILNEKNQLIENDQKGELCFHGSQVINGYLNNTNSDKFIEIYVNNTSKIFYRTGDICSLNKYGNLIFYGRKDNQHKINGHRVDLIEIEGAIKSIINSFFSINCFKDKLGRNLLILFIVNDDFDINSFKSKLSELLPNYMIPQKIILLENMPLNFNNKVDQNQLAQIFEKYQV